MINFKIAAPILLLLMTIGVFTTPVFATTGTISTELKEYTQNPESKTIKYEMILNSEVRSSNVRITWSVKGNSTLVNSKQAVTRISVEAGQSYNIPIEILPAGQGTTEVTAKAEVFQVDGTLTSTVRTNFATNASSEKLPITDEYNESKTLSTIKNIVLTITTIVIVITAGYFGVKLFKRWYKKTPNVEFVTPDSLS